MNIPRPKLKAMILYFATFTDPKFLGKVKLMKLFYFADFVHVKRYASPITFDNYIHMEHGPIPSTILNLINAVENDIDNAFLSDTLSVDIKIGSLQKKIVATRKFIEKDEGYFTPNELKVMQNVCERFADKTSKFIEDQSHKETAWLSTKELDDIPYTLAIGDPDCLVSKEEIELALKVLS